MSLVTVFLSGGRLPLSLLVLSSYQFGTSAMPAKEKDTLKRRMERAVEEADRQERLRQSMREGMREGVERSAEGVREGLREEPMREADARGGEPMREPMREGVQSSETSRRGTLRRRIDRAQTSAASSGSSDSLLNSLRKYWGSGAMSSRIINEIATGATDAGASGRMLEHMSRAMRPDHLQRSLLNLFGTPQGVPPFTWIPLQMASGSTLHPVILPHLFFGRLYHDKRDFWEKHIRGPAGAALTFWNNIANSAIVRDHTGLSERRLAMTLPLGMHGDGGSFSKQDSLFVISWNSILGTNLGGDGFGQRFLFTIVRKNTLTEETLPELFRVLAWSFNALLTGIHPEEDWNRVPQTGATFIADAWRASLIQLRGDWEFLSNVIGLPHWQNNERMCWKCLASNIGGLRWHDFSEGAEWRRTLLEHHTYERRAGAPLPLLFRLVVGLTLACVCVDMLHTIDLGVASHVIANVFQECIRRNVWGGGTVERNTERLQEEIREWYHKNKAKSKIQGELTWARLKTNSGWPKLKSKAAAARHLAAFTAELARKHCGHDARIVAVAQLLNEFYMTLDAEAFYLSDAAVARLPELGQHLCVLYADLSRSALDDNRKMWKATPKWHLFIHLVKWDIVDNRLNPKSYWTYADEDLVGCLVEVASSCHPTTMPTVSLSKWCILRFG